MLNLLIETLILADELLRHALEALNTYSNVIIAIFTGAAFVIAIIQVRELLRGPDIALYFADEQLPLTMPRIVKDYPLIVSFFTVNLLFLNKGPKVGAIAQVNLELLKPKPDRETFFDFRCSQQEPINGKLPVATIQGNSAASVPIRCQIQWHHDRERPITTIGPVRIKVNYSETRGKSMQPAPPKEREFKIILASYSGTEYEIASKLFMITLE